MIPEQVTEGFLHYLWQHRLYDPFSMYTSTGEKVEVIDPGKLNPDSGPDFFNAKIRTGNTTWAGNVEVHLRSSDWLKHGHHLDRAYENVILQVVAENDMEIKRNNGQPLPAVELKYDTRLLENLSGLVCGKNRIPCEGRTKDYGILFTDEWLGSLAMERLEAKSVRLLKILRENKNDWEETLYRQLARNFGLSLNAMPFEMVAVNTPLKILSKHKDNPAQVEALLFGQAGMLGDPGGDQYYRHLSGEYHYLSRKYSLIPVERHLWKFMRLRPSNFPTVRIAQFAALIRKSWGLFSRVTENPEPQHLRELFSSTASAYWDNHYVFNKESIRSKKKTGRLMLNLLLINTVIPLLYLYGKLKNNKYYSEKSFEMLKSLEAENNSVINKWKELKVNVPNAFFSQALLHLKNEYCNRRECLRCEAGKHFTDETS